MNSLRRPLFSAAFAALLALMLGPAPLLAYDLNGGSWASGSIVMQLQLGQPSAPLLDGSTHWDDVAAAALDLWNPVLQRSQFTYVKQSTAPKARANNRNNVFFDSTVYGEAFGSRVLAITLLRSTGSRFVESDVVVNTANTWNSYRGPRGSRAAVDLRRVLAHEFGHALGLDHPDQASPPQSVAAIMNSLISNLDTLQDDDIAGAQMLYDTVSSTAPFLSDQTVNAGSPLALVPTAGAASYVSYTWTFTRPGGSPQVLLDGDGNPWRDASYRLFSAQPEDSGTYTATRFTTSSTSETASAVVTVRPVSTAGARLANLSARARAGVGDDTFIAGFVVGGATAKRVLVRALGPALAGALANPLANPRLTLLHSSQSGYQAVATNDDWSANASEASALRSTAQRLGASPLANGSKDAAFLVTLAPGVYSARVDSVDGTTGIALVEAYDADDSVAQALPRRLMNISSRSFAGNGDETLIAGFVIDGTSPKQVLIRAVGPGLAGAGVANYNPDPNLQLFKAGNGTPIADNDDWAYSNQTGILPAVFTKVGAGQLPAESYDSALLITLPPGVYSAQSSGRSGETGVIVIEVYEVPE